MKDNTERMKRDMKVAVVGCGNWLAGDDAVGLEVLQRLPDMLSSVDFPGLDVELIELGTGGLDVIDYLLECDRAIVVDAVLADGEPGEVVLFAAGSIPSSDQIPFSLHGIDLSQALTLGFKLYPEQMPRLVQVIGVDVGTAPEDFSFGMSEAVESAVLDAARAVIGRLEEWSDEVCDGNA